jgi:glycosyltransferase involved in cell wall biosynthesis
MRLFYFITKSEIGGAQTVLYELLRAHKERNDEVQVMASGNDWLSKMTTDLGYVYICNESMQKTYNPFKILRAVNVYKKAIRAFCPDIISCHSSFSGVVGRVGAWNKYPVVYTAHGWGFTQGVSLPRKIIAIIAEKFSSFFCKKIICVSHFDKSQALKFHIAKDEKMVVIHNGVDVGISKKPPNNNIVFVGRFARPKRQDLALEAYRNLPEDLKMKNQLVFIGDGPQKEHFLKQINKNEIIKGNLARKETMEELSSASIALLISDWEGLPMTILEALQLGIPIVANAAGGIPEALDNSVGRLLKRLPTSVEITVALEELLRDEQLREMLGNNAITRSVYFSTKRMANETFTLYESMV